MCIRDSYIGTILNIEEDHLDYFTGGLEQITDSFLKFAQILPEEGLLIANGDDPQVQKILPKIKAKIATFGLGEENFWRAVNIRYDALGKPTTQFRQINFIDCRLRSA